MSHSNRMEKIQLAAMVLVCFGFLALAIPLVCQQLVPKIEVQSFDAPGRSTLKLEDAGSYVLYYERFSDDDPSVQQSEKQAAPQLKIEISKSDVNRGRPISMNGALDKYLYHLGRRKGVSLYTIQILQPGEYVVKSYYPAGNGLKLRMSVGQQSTLNSSTMRMAMVILIAVMSISTILTLIVFIVKITKS